MDDLVPGSFLVRGVRVHTPVAARGNTFGPALPEFISSSDVRNLPDL
jgi:hypothetical protein